MRRSRVAAWCGPVAAFLIVGTASAAVLGLTSATIDVFRYPVAITPVVAGVDIKPERLDLRSAGVPVTAFIELPSGGDVRRIDRGSIRLCVGTDPCPSGVPVTGKAIVGDADGDGITDLKIAFDRGAVIDLALPIPRPMDVTYAISGLLGTDGFFVGTDVVRLEPRR